MMGNVSEAEAEDMHVVTFETALLVGGIRTELAGMRLALGMPCYVHAQFRLVAE